MEIERKFLVKSLEYKSLAKPKLIIQGYLCTEPDRTVRIRIMNDCAFITIKSRTIGVTRQEFEYQIPMDDAKTMIDTMCTKIIEKQRYTICLNEHTWEIDEFFGNNAGLVIAEIELSDENESFIKPDWIGEEVSHNSQYFNSNLNGGR